MKVYEKTLELNIGAELLTAMRTDWGMRKAYLRGLTQREERTEGTDLFAQLAPDTRLFAFQFKAPLGKDDKLPYRYTLKHSQHNALHNLAVMAPHSVFYVFPFYASSKKLRRDLPHLWRDTWLLRAAVLDPNAVFGSAQTKTVRCWPGTASTNPEYEMIRAIDADVTRDSGAAPQQFASWYEEYRGAPPSTRTGRRHPWIVRGLKIGIVTREDDQ